MWACASFNFSAGPLHAPHRRLEAAKVWSDDWQGSGSSVMEVSHRGKAFVAAAAETGTPA